MSRRTAADRAIVPVSTVLITLALMVLAATTVTDHNAQRQHWLLLVALGGVAVLCAVAASRHLSAVRGLRHEQAGGERYWLLAQEYRRLSDLAVTAQEHSDLKLAEVTAQPDHIQAQMDSLHRILREAGSPAAVHAGHCSPDADSRPKTGCRRLPAGLPATPLPPARPGMTHRDGQSMCRWTKSAHNALLAP